MILAALLIAAMQEAQDVQPLSPVGSPSDWVRDGDYPAYALRSGHQGDVRFDLLVDEAGRVSNCAVTISSGHEELDLETCRLLTERARFRPAMRGGKPIAAHFISRMRWTLPPVEPKPLVSWYAMMIIKVSKSGEVLSCEKQTVSGPDGLVDPCSGLRGGIPPRLLAATGGAGIPHTLSFEFVLTVTGSAAPALLYSKFGQIRGGRKQEMFDVSEDGRVENCHSALTEEEGILANFPGICADTSRTYVPATGSDGKPRRTSATFTIALSRGP